MDSNLIENLFDNAFLGERELVEEGVIIVENRVTVGHTFRWEILSRRSEGIFDHESVEREFAAYLLRDEVSSLAAVMPRLVGALGNDTIVVEAVDGGRTMWESGSASVAVGLLAAVHREAQDLKSWFAPIPWILECTDVGVSSRIWEERAGPLGKICSRASAVSALRRLRECWRPHTYIHGNADLHNVVLGPDGRPRFVNWGSSGRGDSTWDIAALCLRPVLMRVRRKSPIRSWWAQVVDEIAVSMDLHAKVSGHRTEATKIVGMIGAWVLQVGVAAEAERNDSADMNSSLAAGCELLENTAFYARELDSATCDGGPSMRRGEG